MLRNLSSSPDSWLCDTDPAQGDHVIVTEEDVQQATQERGAVDTLPPIRQRPGIRRALNAALIRFPAFRLKGSRHEKGPRTRSKSASSASVLEGWSEKPSRHPSDATSRKKTSSEFGMDIRRVISGGEASPRRVPTPTSAGFATPANGGARGGWGARLALQPDGPSPTIPPLPRLSRSISASSVGQVGRPKHLLSTSAGNSPRPSSSSRFESTGSGGLSDTESTGRRRTLTKMLSRLGGRRTPRPAVSRKSSLSEDDDASATGSTTAPGGIGTRSMLDMFSNMTDFDTVTDDDVATSDYSSDDDDELGGPDELDGPPLRKLDSLSGWHSTFSPFGVDSTDFGGEGGLVDEKAPLATFNLDDSTPRASAHVALAMNGLDPDPSLIPPPLVRQSSETPTKRPQTIRDGSIRSGFEPGTKRWHVSAEDGYLSSEHEEPDEDDDEGTEIFVAPRRKKAQTIAEMGNP